MTERLFSNLKFHILSTGIGKKRLKLFENQIHKYGGQTVNNVNDSAYLIVEDSLDIFKLKKVIQECNHDLKIVKSAWLSKCLENKCLLETSDFEIIDKKRKDPEISDFIPIKTKKHKLENLPNDAFSTENILPQSNRTESEWPNLSSTWVCSYSAANKVKNHNEHITEKLEILAETYKNTKDNWRALGYQKAVTTLKKHSKEITTYEEALSLPGVGKSLANKIWEIIESGHLRKIDEVCFGERMQTINLFTKVWGAGPTTAEIWVQQGFRTLEDLRTKAKLSHQQQIGLKHYHDLLDRMPREEATDIVEMVKSAAISINSGLQVVACGSYRRGKSTCGDVDVLITHPDGKSHIRILTPIVNKLHETGFITDDLVKHGEYGSHIKFLGVCKLPGTDRKHRRLDIITVPYNELACAMLYFTGSAHFNRSMRLLSRKKGMALSEHSLKDGVIRKGEEKLNEGYIIPTPTEQSVFQYLKLEYRTPEERDH